MRKWGWRPTLKGRKLGETETVHYDHESVFELLWWKFSYITSKCCKYLCQYHLVSNDRKSCVQIRLFVSFSGLFDDSFLSENPIGAKPETTEALRDYRTSSTSFRGRISMEPVLLKFLVMEYILFHYSSKNVFLINGDFFFFLCKPEMKFFI